MKKGRVAIGYICCTGPSRMVQTGTGETWEIKPFRKINIPVFARVDKAIDAFVEEKWYSKAFPGSGMHIPEKVSQSGGQ